MNISPIRFNSYYNKTVTNKIKNSPAFGDVCANVTHNNIRFHDMFAYHNPDYIKYRTSTTRIFRELPSELAIAKLLNLNPNQKSQIKILGCSDGSEAWAHAIITKEVMGENAKNVDIQAVDLKPAMIKTAKTGCVVLSDIEHDYAQGKTAIYEEKSPIAYDGWDKYFTKTDRPRGFNKILRNYPFMKYHEYDPVLKKGIGSGLNWYKVNQKGLPKVSFKCGDIFNYIKPDKNAKNVVYVMANSAYYLFFEDPNNFLDLFEEISLENEGKNVYVVLGDYEDRLLNLKGYADLNSQEQRNLKTFIRMYGFENIPEDKLKDLGIITNDLASRKIYQLVRNPMFFSRRRISLGDIQVLEMIGIKN